MHIRRSPRTNRNTKPSLHALFVLFQSCFAQRTSRDIDSAPVLIAKPELHESVRQSVPALSAR